MASRAAAPGGGGGEAGAGTGGKGELEPYLEALLGQREAAEDLLVRHPELGAGGKATPAAAQRSVEALEGAGLSLKTIRALVRSCPRLLWRGAELAQVVAGTAPLPPGAQGLRPQSWLQEEFKLKGPEPDYPGFWVGLWGGVYVCVGGGAEGEGPWEHSRCGLPVPGVLRDETGSRVKWQQQQQGRHPDAEPSAGLAAAAQRRQRAQQARLDCLPASLPSRQVPDYDPVHSSVTGVPCKWVGGPRPPVDLFVDRLLQLTVLAHALPASDDEWSDDEG